MTTIKAADIEDVPLVVPCQLEVLMIVHQYVDGGYSSNKHEGVACQTQLGSDTNTVSLVKR
ncbi:hypothetical protein [Deinococcus indicus]|uniref:hypothetical protein n=1 Tax=Deinococcus indicus TaxID=223556 RepID=UPI001748081E|nr:hypothetical protein [Deinococcus indicus]